MQRRSEPAQGLPAASRPLPEVRRQHDRAHACVYLTSLQTRLREWLRCLSRAVTRNLKASSSWSVTTTCGMPVLLGAMPSSLRARTVRCGEGSEVRGRR